jgi:hypothetical protein
VFQETKLQETKQVPVSLPRGKVESVSDDGLVQMRLPDGHLLRRRIPLEQVPNVRRMAFGPPSSSSADAVAAPHG